MSKNLVVTRHDLKKLEFIKLLGLEEPSQLPKCKLKSKRITIKKASCTGCSQDCDHRSKENYGTELTQTKVSKGRKRLHNEKTKIYFCSVPSCSYSSKYKRRFEEHYENCFKMYQKCF